MKKLIKILAVVLSVLCVIPMFACQGVGTIIGGSGTEDDGAVVPSVPSSENYVQVSDQEWVERLNAIANCSNLSMVMKSFFYTQTEQIYMCMQVEADWTRQKGREIRAYEQYTDNVSPTLQEDKFVLYDADERYYYWTYDKCEYVENQGYVYENLKNYEIYKKDDNTWASQNGSTNFVYNYDYRTVVGGLAEKSNYNYNAQTKEYYCDYVVQGRTLKEMIAFLSDNSVLIKNYDYIEGKIISTVYIYDINKTTVTLPSYQPAV